jgi:hypothetical protein
VIVGSQPSGFGPRISRTEAGVPVLTVAAGGRLEAIMRRKLLPTRDRAKAEASRFKYAEDGGPGVWTTSLLGMIGGLTGLIMQSEHGRGCSCCPRVPR